MHCVIGAKTLHWKLNAMFAQNKYFITYIISLEISVEMFHLAL
jgi:hypothetical protein